MKLMECPTCGWVSEVQHILGPKDCPKLLSNEERKKLGLKPTKVPKHLADVGIAEKDNLGGICNTKLVDVSEEDAAGAQMIIKLQKVANVNEGLPKALRGWRSFSDKEKRQTKAAFDAIYGGVL